MKTATSTQTMVERMREIRDQVSHDIMNMSLKEERAYLAEQLKKLKAKRKKANR
jgi:predicted oxidoreductase